MEKDFDEWNEVKKQTEFKNNQPEFFPEEREVWMCTIGKNIGREQNGGGDNFSRPVLIVKKFNNEMFWVLSLSSKQKNRDFYWTFTDPLSGQKASVILAQLKLTSIKRFNRKLYEFSLAQFEEIRSYLRLLIS